MAYNIADDLGPIDLEFVRVAAVNHCKEVLTLRGWQVGETDPKCIYDLFAVKGLELRRVQVRSSGIMSRRGWPIFKTGRILFNTKVMKRTVFSGGDFDYWFFYTVGEGSWLIPFGDVTQRSTVSMENFEDYRI
jgi:hypothetical protein